MPEPLPAAIFVPMPYPTGEELVQEIALFIGGQRFRGGPPPPNRMQPEIELSEDDGDDDEPEEEEEKFNI